MPDKTLQNRILKITLAIYTGLLIYASLMPYDFSPSVDQHWVLQRALNQWPINPQAHISGSDLLSNLLLYIPLGLLLASLLSKSGKKWLWPCSISLLVCFWTSLIIETAQAFTLSRTASIADLITNSLSGLLGSVLGARYGRGTWELFYNWLSIRWRYHPRDILTLFLVTLLSADALTPFLPTLLLSQVWRSIKRSHFNPLAGLTLHPWHWWLVHGVLVYFLLTLLASYWNGKRIPTFYLVTISSLFATALEIGKIFIVSRSLNLANIVAALIGIILATMLTGMRRDNPISNRVLLKFGLLLLFIYIFYLAWFPFDFHYDQEMISQKLPRPVELLPFYHYAMGASLNHVRLFVQTLVLSATLVYLVRFNYPGIDKSARKWISALAAPGLIGLLQEGGQLFLASRTPAMTDIYCYMMGGVIATLLPLQRRNELESQPPEGDDAD